jgi:hypothetical protein
LVSWAGKTFQLPTRITSAGAPSARRRYFEETVQSINASTATFLVKKNVPNSRSSYPTVLKQATGCPIRICDKRLFGGNISVADPMAFIFTGVELRNTVGAPLPIAEPLHADSRANRIWLTFSLTI